MSTKPIAQSAAKVVIYDLATGEALERWPVDASALVKTGAFGYAPPVLEAAVDEALADAVVADEAPADEAAPRKRRG